MPDDDGLLFIDARAYAHCEYNHAKACVADPHAAEKLGPFHVAWLKRLIAEYEQTQKWPSPMEQINFVCAHGRDIAA